MSVGSQVPVSVAHLCVSNGLYAAFCFYQSSKQEKLFERNFREFFSQKGGNIHANKNNDAFSALLCPFLICSFDGNH